MNLIQNVRQTIEGYQLFHQGDRVLVGVSGGPDSMTLLHILYQLRHSLGIRLEVIHFNHRIRKDALKDLRLVRQVCQSLHLPFHFSSPPVRFWRRQKESENLARELRLDFFTRVAQQCQATCLALGHNQDDQAETVLMRIIRGTGLFGLRGILPKRQIKGLVIVRPLFQIQRKEIEQYVKKEKIAHRIDSTNQQRRFTRNKIRLDLIPYLEKEFNPKIKAHLAQLAQSSFLDYEVLRDLAVKELNNISILPKKNNMLKWHRTRFMKLPQGLQRILIRLAIEKLRPNANPITMAHIREIEEMLKERPLGSLVHLPGRLSIQKEKETISWATKSLKK